MEYLKEVMYLIIKELVMPVKIPMLEALVRRLPKNHVKRATIEDDLARRVAGYRGEQSLEYYLKNFIPEKDYMIFRGLRIPIGNTAFQLDTLLISLYFALIIEVKNYSGTLYFEQDFGQVIQTSKGISKVIPNPILQVKRQQQQLLKWIASHQFKKLPIEYLVTISNPSTKLETAPGNKEVTNRILHNERNPDKINQFELLYNKKIISPTFLNKLSQTLLNKHSLEEINILKSYGIMETELITGVQCLYCSRFGMIRQQCAWFCTNCLATSNVAHKQAILDYLLLVSPTISNFECRKFLHISSTDVAKRLLISMNLSTTGKYKNRVYHRPTHC
jgi:hypothetical protein